MSGKADDVLAVLRGAASALTIVAIAGQLGVHPNTVRFHLDTLLEDGRVELVEPDERRPGRPPLRFQAARRMDPGGQRHYRLLAEILTLAMADDDPASAKARQAGRAWGRRMVRPTGKPPGPRQSRNRLLGLLAELGFAPHRSTAGDGQHLALRHCPFLELAEEKASVVCAIHLGLMQGALEAWKAPITVDRLEPFVEPDLCLAHVTSLKEDS